VNEGEENSVPLPPAPEHLPSPTKGLHNGLMQRRSVDWKGELTPDQLSEVLNEEQKAGEEEGGKGISDAEWEAILRLPSGWEERVDAKKGRKYYVDHNTGSTSWEPPSAADFAKDKAPKAAKVAAKVGEKGGDYITLTPEQLSAVLGDPVLPDAPEHLPTSTKGLHNGLMQRRSVDWKGELTPDQLSEVLNEKTTADLPEASKALRNKLVQRRSVEMKVHLTRKELGEVLGKENLFHLRSPGKNPF
jgi:hypothetical protein